MIALLIAGNALFAVLLAVFWTKYLSLKKSSEAEISTLKENIENELKEVSNTENQMREGLMADNKKIETLMQELSEARKEKEEEIKLRMEAEKHIALAIQKAEDIQKRMQDWKIAQEAAMKDSQNAIIKVGEDLYQKINASHQAEIANNKTLFEKVADYIKQATTAPQNLVNSAVRTVTSTPKAATKSETPATVESAPKTAATSDITKKMVGDLVKSMQDSGYADGAQYFLSNSFDAEKSKLFLCEAAFLQNPHFYIFDFKSCNFLNEYNLATDKDAAQKTLAQKLDKYVAYLSNPKYRNAILKAATSKDIHFDNGDIIVVVPAHSDLETLEHIGYIEKLEHAGAKVATFDEILDLTL